MTDLKKVREDRGMTQGDLAIKSGISQAIISMYEMGKRRPTPLKMEVLARSLDCEVIDISYKLSESMKKLVATIDSLTVEQLQDVNEFVEFLKWRRLQKKEF